MPENIRALVVVLLAAVIAFYIAKKLTFSTITNLEFEKWRNAWFAATIVGFLSDSFFAFAAVLVCISVYVYKTRATIIGAFFVLLFTMPLVDATIGVFGAIQNLITLNIARVLAITLLLPVLITNRPSARIHNRSAAVVDRLIVLYGLLVVVLEFRRAELTSVLRAGTQLSLDVLIPYFAISRGVTSIQDYKKVLTAFVIAILPLSFIATVATIKGWPIYNSVILNW